mgnify:FL=1
MPTTPVTEEDHDSFNLSTVSCNRPEYNGDKQLEIVAGPLLRFWGMEMNPPLWRGSISYVTKDSGSDYERLPYLYIYDQPLLERARCFAQVQGFSFWRFEINLTPDDEDSLEVRYHFGKEHPEFSFWIPGAKESMRTMFSSCNGFSLSANPKYYSGSLWDDVMAQHEERPFHVMLGGGDQLYSDSIIISLSELNSDSTEPLTEKSKVAETINKFYMKQYCNWYGKGNWKGPHGETSQPGWVQALATIPWCNVYDDQGIIDECEAYDEKTMSRPIFALMGEYAYRYYMLFQQNVHYTDDFRLKDPSWITTGKQGAFIKHPARSIYARLGKSISFLGLDCRTERKKDQICTYETYSKVFDRISYEVRVNPDIKHIYFMIGVPIAYPKMVSSDNPMSNKMISPIKWFSKKKMTFEGLVNSFDGPNDVLEDPSDYWTYKEHKTERNAFIKRLMDFQHMNNVRITIISGDMHLCAVGLFQSIRHMAPEKDGHFMVCPVLSAIVNAPSPPDKQPSLMDRRNKKYIFGTSISERLVPIFNKDVDGTPLSNKTTVARRSYMILDPVTPGSEPQEKQYPGPLFSRDSKHDEIAKHNKAITVVEGSIRMLIQVEADPKDKEGKTVPYEMFIPTLSIPEHIETAQSRSVY